MQDVKQTGSRAATYAAAMVTIILWATAFPATKYSLEYFSPGSLMLFRFIAASATLIIAGMIKKIRLPEKKDLPMFALAGFVGIFLYMMFFNSGTVHVDSGISSFIIASAPIFAIIASRILLAEKVSKLCWLGVSVSLGGIAVITVSQTVDYAMNIGIVLLLLAAITSSGHNVIQRKLLKKYTALEATTYSITAATLVMLVFTPTLIRELPYSTAGVNLIVIYLGVFPAAIAYLFWGYALSKTAKTSHVVVFLYLIPFVALLLGYIWLDEVLSAWAVVGGVIIIIGMILANAKKAQ